MNCAACGGDDATFQCGKCKSMAYCGRECQKSHWKVHKKICCVADQPVIKQGVDKTALPRVLRLQHPFLVVDHSTLPELGLGLFTNKAIKAGTNLAVGNAIAANKAISNATNDAVLPDFVTLFSKSASQAQKDAAWQRYMTESKEAENVTFHPLSAGEKLLLSMDNEEIFMPMVASRDIAAGEELFTCYGIGWFPNLHAEFMDSVEDFAMVTGGEYDSKLRYLVDLPAGCKIVGATLEDKVLANTSKKDPADLLHLTAEEVGHWVNEMHGRTCAAVHGTADLSAMERRFQAGLLAEGIELDVALDSDEDDPVVMQSVRSIVEDCVSTEIAKVKAAGGKL